MSDLQKRFMFMCGQTTEVINFAQIALYRELIREELVKELLPAIDKFLEDPLDKNTIRELIDGIGDVDVVVSGVAYSIGLDPVEIKRRIDLSNLSKATGGKIIKREDGKILKPESFRPPELEDLVDKVYKELEGLRK